MDYDSSVKKELTEKYVGKKVKKDCRDRFNVEEELLSEKFMIDCSYDDDGEEGGVEAWITQWISVEVRGGVIAEIETYCHTSCWGDSGLGEEAPDEHFFYGDYYEAAEEYVKGLLEDD